MYIRSLGIVLREADYKDYDKMLTIFTRDFGKLSAIARGARKQGSPLLACSDVFCCADYSFYRTKDHASISQAQTVSSFFNIRSDIDALTAASIFADVCDKTAMEGEANARLFALLASALYSLDGGCDPCSVLVFFAFKALDILGFRPHMNSCVSCGAPAADKVNIALGGAVCENCEGERISHYSFEQIKHIFTVASKNMAGELPAVDRELLSLAERWLVYSLDVRPKGFKLLHSLTGL